MNLAIRSVCTRCRNETHGRLTFDDVMKLIDSDGGMVFNDGWHCHNCLDQPYSSADLLL